MQKNIHNYKNTEKRLQESHDELFGGVNEDNDSNSPIKGQKYDGPYLTTYRTETQMLIAKIKDGHRIDKKYEKNN